MKIHHEKEELIADEFQKNSFSSVNSNTSTKDPFQFAINETKSSNFPKKTKGTNFRK